MANLPPVSSNDPHVSAHNNERTEINGINAALLTKITKPSGAAFGDMLLYNGTSWVSSETRFLEGDGPPDGVVAAPQGSRYVDKTSSTGGVEWVKRAGLDSNTGWACLSGETGPRNVAAQILTRSGGAINKAILQRSGQVVHFYLDLKMGSSTASPYKVYDIPVGFRPTHDIYGGLTDNKEGADTGGTLVSLAGAINIYNPVAGKTDRYHGIWPTTNAWPTSLPGSAA